MNKPSWLQANVNIGNILSIATVVIGVTTTLVVNDARLDALEQFRDKRVVETNARFDKLDTLTQQIPQLSLRMSNAEGQLTAMGGRLDSGFSVFSARLDRNAEATATGLASINTAIGALDTRVAVLTQRVESLNQERRAELRSLPNGVR